MQKNSRHLLMLALLTVLSLSAYLLTSWSSYRLGFPLDDAWIHQTYARNLAMRHEWAFLPGQPSAGSTAPLWTLLLAPGFFLPLAPYLWTYLLGGLLLFGLAVLAERLARQASPSYQPASPWIGIFFILEWHLAWTAVSGMETLLQIILVTATLGLLIIDKRLYTLMGFLVGLSLWVRPDGVTLLGPLVCYALLVEKTLASRLKALVGLAFGFFVLLIPYLLFNLALSGTPLPNTFYAKQQEYAAWQNNPLWQRSFSGALAFLTGPGLVLLWSFLQKTFREIRARRWGIPLAALWIGGYLLLYTSRLPAYQHGRYLMPALGIFLLIGLLGFCETLPQARSHRERFLRQLALTLLVTFTLVFGAFGAFTYGQDVAFIESEMVDSAQWAARNLPPEALIAAHDIGALGYFGEHPILDLAGLVSPEVIPFIRDEAKLAAYLNTQGAQYLIVFPNWYQTLAKGREPVYAGQGQFIENSGLGSLTIYRWPKP
jgi:hypothetical protein